MRKIYFFILSIFSVASLNAQVISEIYPTGGNSGATYQSDFIEIFNNTGASIDISGYSVQYSTAGSTSGTFLVITTIPSGTILESGQYYLIQTYTPSAPGGSAFPVTPDLIVNTQNLAQAGGKIVLVNSNVAVNISANCPSATPGATVLDFVGYGSANCAETSPAPAPTTTNTNSIQRNLNGCTDTNNNSADFTRGTPSPRNTSSSKISCPTGIILPAKISNLKASQNNNLTTLEFTNETENDVVSYIVERAIDGGNFAKIKELQPSKNNGEKDSYKITDNAATGTSLYRIKIIETTGKTTYSSIVRLDSKNRNPSLVIAPNPIKGKELSIQVSNLTRGSYILKIFGMSGQVISQKNMQFEEGAATYNLPLNNIKPGMYYIEISGAVKMQKQFIVQ